MKEKTMTEEDYKNINDKEIQLEMYMQSIYHLISYLTVDEITELIQELTEKYGIEPQDRVTYHEALGVVSSSPDWLDYIDKPDSKAVCNWIDESLAKDIGYRLMNTQKRTEAKILKEEIEYYE